MIDESKVLKLAAMLEAAGEDPVAVLAAGVRDAAIALTDDGEVGGDPTLPSLEERVMAEAAGCHDGVLRGLFTQNVPDDATMRHEAAVEAAVVRLIAAGKLIRTERPGYTKGEVIHEIVWPAHPNAPKPKGEKAAPAAAAKPVAKRDTKPSKSAAPKDEKRQRVTPAQQAELEARVLVVVEAIATPDKNPSVSDVAGNVAGFTVTQVANALAKLVDAGKLARFGSKKNTTYSVPKSAAPAAVAEAAE